jgi:hypothetical protein
MPEANFIKVACDCGKNFKAPATAVGKRARCPACAAILVITAGPAVRPAGAAASAPASAARRTSAVARQSRPVLETAPAEDPMDALDELARQEEAAVPLQDNTPRCPHCAMPMPPGAVVCTNCGYDARTGKKLAVAIAAKPAKVPAAAGRGKAKSGVDRMAPTGSFAAGLVFSLIFAVAASIIWVALAYLTGFTIGYIAVLIGGAAGVGMQFGHKGYSRAGGYAAAALTLVAILLAKFMVLEMILSRSHLQTSIADLNPSRLGYYFFNPIGLIIIVIGMAAAFRTANGSVTG